MTGVLADAIAVGEKGGTLQALAEAKDSAALKADRRALIARGLVDRYDLQAAIRNAQHY